MIRYAILSMVLVSACASTQAAPQAAPDPVQQQRSNPGAEIERIRSETEATANRGRDQHNEIRRQAAERYAERQQTESDAALARARLVCSANTDEPACARLLSIGDAGASHD